MRERRGVIAIVPWALAALALARPAGAQQPPEPERVSFQDAVARAIERHPTVAQSTQAVRRAQALLGQARAVFLPLVTGQVGESIIDEARAFGDSIVVPRRQTSISGTISVPLFATSRWAAAGHAADQVEIARLSAEDARRQVALTAAEAYLAVLAAQHQQQIALRTRETARALEDYARARLDAGQGSRLNHVRASQELAAAEGLLHSAELALTRAREGLGVAISADRPVAADGEPVIAEPPPPTDDETLVQERPDVRLFSAQADAARHVLDDNWKSWLPTATASFTPQYVTPQGLFEKARTWRAFFQLQVPIFDGTLGSTRRLRTAEREAARQRLRAVQEETRSEVRTAREALVRHGQIAASSQAAAASAAEALRITELAYRAGATTNVEVVQAQQTARSAEVQAALAADRLLQARLHLLVALGRFP